MDKSIRGVMGIASVGTAIAMAALCGASNIRGTLHSNGFTDLKTGTSGTVTEGEYWFAK